MKQSTSISIEEHFPNIKKTDKAPANSLYLLIYAEQCCWQNQEFRIVKQFYDAKDALVNLTEIKVNAEINLPIRTHATDLHWLYILQGGIQIKEHSIHDGMSNFPESLKEDEYGLFYSPPREYRLLLKPGTHLIFLFTVNATWLQRHPIKESLLYKKMIDLLRHKKDSFQSSKILPIHPAIKKEILRILTLPVHEGIQMDTMIYTILVNLLVLSQEDLKKGNQKVNDQKETQLLLIRAYIDEQVLIGRIPTITEIIQFFSITQRSLNRLHNAEFGSSLQQYITQSRLNLAAHLLTTTLLPITLIAFDLNYDKNTFLKQFKKYYGISPSAYRQKLKK